MADGSTTQTTGIQPAPVASGPFVWPSDAPAGFRPALLGGLARVAAVHPALLEVLQLEAIDLPSWTGPAKPGQPNPTKGQLGKAPLEAMLARIGHAAGPRAEGATELVLAAAALLVFLWASAPQARQKPEIEDALKKAFAAVRHWFEPSPLSNDAFPDGFATLLRQHPQITEDAVPAIVEALSAMATKGTSRLDCFERAVAFLQVESKRRPIAKGFQTGNDMTLRAGLGGRYVGSTVSAGPTTSIRTPGNTLADALLELQMPSWTFALNVRVHAWRLAVDRTAVPPGADRRGNRRADRAPATARLHDDAAAFAAAPSRRLRCPPLKVLWALLDLMTILVLVSGLYLWFKRGSTETRIAEIERRPHQRRGSRPMSRAPSASRSPFIAPAWTGAACFIGLVSALIGDGVRRDLVAGVHAADRTFRPRMDDARAQGLIRGSVESFESEQGL